jgi:hypothetical protein
MSEESRDVDGGGRTRGKKAAARKTTAEIPRSRSAKEGDVSTMTTTATAPATSGSTTSAPAAAQKDIWDFLGNIAPGVAGAAAQEFGLDPRVAGQTVSSLLNVFGIGGGGKAFTAAVPQAQAKAQLEQMLSPHLNDPAFATALATWLQAAVEPVQAHKEGKDYQPSVDLSKDWFTEAINSVGEAIGSVDWGKVAQVGMSTLPYVLALL